ncbi:MAG TPA: hypothetical protein VJN63_00220 [Thermoplasmata archaeon]|nr:hypothetical protein [Thermoplasmata archaeon]
MGTSNRFEVVPPVAVEDGVPTRELEVRREIACAVCRGDWKRCRLSTCPYLANVRRWFTDQTSLASTSLFGASPPSAFVGSWGYPKVLTGPLVPPIREGTAIMDAPETWLDLDLSEILRFRLSLVRGKAQRPVEAARKPDRILEATQLEAMAAKPVDMELWLEKKPVLVGPFSARASPTGPSAMIRKLTIAENPSVPRRVDYITSDPDLRATEGVADLYGHGIAQGHITRIFSVGLLGTGKRRKLVPTEWSITAVDDILGRQLTDQVKGFPPIDEFRVFSARAHHNTVAVLLIPTAWMFEGLEVWDIERMPTPISDHEMYRGRRTYPDRLAGAYHATRLPVLEYLERERRQAGAIVFMEVHRGWIPLGVWRYREIARAALSRPPSKFSRIDDAEAWLRARLQLPLENWWRASVLRRYLRDQRRITDFAR